MAFNRGFDVTESESRTKLMEATVQLLIEEGYYAISARRIAEIAQLKPQLVHYYFRSMDELVLTVYRELASEYRNQIEKACADPHPLRALWVLASSRTDNKIGVEFIGISGRVEVLRNEMARERERFRILQTEAVERALKKRKPDPRFTAPGIVLLLTAVSRSLAIEEAMGVTMAHEDLRKLVDELLDYLEPLDEAGAS